MHKLSYGLYIVTTKDGEKANGCIVNTAIQAASTPNQLCICINNANYTHDMVLKTGVFNVSVLSKTAQFLLYQRFGFQSGREVDKFADYTAYQNAENGVPYITEGTNAYLAVKVTQTVDLGSHTMFIGEVKEDDEGTYLDIVTRGSYAQCAFLLAAFFWITWYSYNNLSIHATIAQVIVFLGVLGFFVHCFWEDVNNFNNYPNSTR